MSVRFPRVARLVQIPAGAVHRVVRAGVLPLVGSSAAHGIDDRQQLCPNGRRLTKQEVERRHVAPAILGRGQPLDAGLEASSVRRLLTSQAANPTTDNAFRLMAAMGISLEATMPTGERVQLIDADARISAAGRPAAA